MINQKEEPNSPCKECKSQQPESSLFCLSSQKYICKDCYSTLTPDDDLQCKVSGYFQLQSGETPAGMTIKLLEQHIKQTKQKLQQLKNIYTRLLIVNGQQSLKDYILQIQKKKKSVEKPLEEMQISLQMSYAKKLLQPDADKHYSQLQQFVKQDIILQADKINHLKKQILKIWQKRQPQFQNLRIQPKKILVDNPICAVALDKDTYLIGTTLMLLLYENGKELKKISPLWVKCLTVSDEGRIIGAEGNSDCLFQLNLEEFTINRWRDCSFQLGGYGLTTTSQMVYYSDFNGNRIFCSRYNVTPPNIYFSKELNQPSGLTHIQDDLFIANTGSNQIFIVKDQQLIARVGKKYSINKPFGLHRLGRILCCIEYKNYGNKVMFFKWKEQQLDEMGVIGLPDGFYYKVSITLEKLVISEHQYNRLLVYQL